jgi:hypothetical protein
MRIRITDIIRQQRIMDGYDRYIYITTVRLDQFVRSRSGQITLDNGVVYEFEEGDPRMSMTNIIVITSPEPLVFACSQGISATLRFR